MIGRLEVIIESVERVVGIAETAMLPLSATESVVRGVVSAVRGRTGLQVTAAVPSRNASSQPLLRSAEASPLIVSRIPRWTSSSSSPAR